MFPQPFQGVGETPLPKHDACDLSGKHGVSTGAQGFARCGVGYRIHAGATRPSWGKNLLSAGALFAPARACAALFNQSRMRLACALAGCLRIGPASQFPEGFAVRPETNPAVAGDEPVDAPPLLGELFAPIDMR
jgi:hypothetical protein